MKEVPTNPFKNVQKRNRTLALATCPIPAWESTTLCERIAAASSGHPRPFRSTIIYWPSWRAHNDAPIRDRKNHCPNCLHFYIKMQTQALNLQHLAKTLEALCADRFCAHQGRSWREPSKFPFLVTSLWNDKEVTHHRRRVVAATFRRQKL